jgi:hypothetical protein
MRDNFIAGLMSYTDTVRKGMPAQYKAQVEAATKAGMPLAQRDADDLASFLKAQSGETQAAAEGEKVLATA